MNVKLKKGLIGLGIAAAIIGSFLGGSKVSDLDIAIPKDTSKREPAVISEELYNKLKQRVIDRYYSDEPLTWQEFQILIAILDSEAKRGKLRGIKKQAGDDLIPLLIDKIK